MTKPLRWGILSTANIGVQKVIPAIQQDARSIVTAICSRSLDSARNAADKLGIEKAYGSYEALLADLERALAQGMQDAKADLAALPPPPQSDSREIATQVAGN